MLWSDQSVLRHQTDFIVAAPDRDARMVAQALQIIARFQAHVVHEIVVERRIGRAREFEIQPDANARFIAGIEERIILVKTAAPKTQGIHVDRHGIRDVAP